jgi:hypothetical protein
MLAAPGAAEAVRPGTNVRLVGRTALRQNRGMSNGSRPLTYTEIELKGYLPSGWGIRRGSVGRWDGSKGAWSIEVYDPADNAWPLVVEGKAVSESGRLVALQRSVDELYRNALG